MTEARLTNVDEPGFARWLNGDMTKFCGHGYHQGGDGMVCEGTISTAGITADCLCGCHV